MLDCVSSEEEDKYQPETSSFSLFVGDMTSLTIYPLILKYNQYTSVFTPIHSYPSFGHIVIAPVILRHRCLLQFSTPTSRVNCNILDQGKLEGNTAANLVRLQNKGQLLS